MVIEFLYVAHQILIDLMKPLKITLLALLASALFSNAADFRTWTSLKGGTVEAQLTSYDKAKGGVTLTTKEAKIIKLKSTDLSLADKQYLIEFADADKDILYKSTPAVPEKAYRKPKDFLRKLEQTFSLGDDSEQYELYESAHYVYAVSKGIKPNGIAETAEACWHGMAFQHFEFRENWGDTRQLILLPDGEDLYKSVGKYEVKALKEAGHEEYAGNVQATWDRTGSNRFTVPDDAAESLKLKPRGIVFNVRDKKNFRKAFNSFQTHNIASNLFGEQVGSVSSISGNGYFTLSTGHAYYKEIQLTKKTETNLLSNDYAKGVGSKSGFKDGTSWAKTLQKMVKKGDIKPNLAATLAIKSANDLTPEKLVTMYSLSCYMQSTQKRIAAYAKLARQINTSDQVPEINEMAKIFGFASAKEMEKDWIEFIKSRDFK